MVEEQQVPDWLAMGEQQQREEPSMKEGPRRQAIPDTLEQVRGQTGRADVMEGLREQMIRAEEEFEFEEEAGPRLFLNLAPWQRLVLAVLLFLDVALCGCMALVMTGRVALPF